MNLRVRHSLVDMDSSSLALNITSEANEMSQLGIFFILLIVSYEELVCEQHSTS